MASMRPLRMSEPSRHSSLSPHSSASNHLSQTTLRCRVETRLKRANWICRARASLAASETETHTSTRRIDLPLLLTIVTHTVSRTFRPPVKRLPWKLQFQLFIERAILDCRFFTLLAVAGSLIGSVLCFLEGAFTVIESYLQYFNALSQKSDQTHVIHLLVEAIDLFLIGTAMLLFGMGIYSMFVGAKNKGGKALPKWIEIESVSEAKSRFGHAVTLLLQVGVLEKFQSIPLVTGLDLACFAGAVLLSSACIFLLSRLSGLSG